MSTRRTAPGQRASTVHATGDVPTGPHPGTDRTITTARPRPASEASAVHLLVFSPPTAPSWSGGVGWVLESWHRNGCVATALDAHGAGERAPASVAQAVATRVLAERGAPVQRWYPAGGDELTYRSPVPAEIRTHQLPRSAVSPAAQR